MLSGLEAEPRSVVAAALELPPIDVGPDDEGSAPSLASGAPGAALAVAARGPHAGREDDVPEPMGPGRTDDRADRPDIRERERDRRSSAAAMLAISSRSTRCAA
jgi:hypothetical protein